jgi:DNA-binding response OmpR family regulator
MTMTLSRKPPTILIIEDDPVSSNLLKNIFSNEGYLIREATDGIKGLETALIEPPDLICLDVILPGLSGYEVCRSIRQEAAGANIPILMITSLTKREDIVKGLKSGATDYITKPFSSVEVLARVKVNLDHRFANPSTLSRSFSTSFPKQRSSSTVTAAPLSPWREAGATMKTFP